MKNMASDGVYRPISLSNYQLFSVIKLFITAYHLVGCDATSSHYYHLWLFIGNRPFPDEARQQRQHGKKIASINTSDR